MSGQIATQTMAKPTFTPVARGLLQRCTATTECDECRKNRPGTLQRTAINSSPTHDVPPMIDEVLRSPGQPLDAATRALMEPRFGRDFSRVPIDHTQNKLVVNAPGDAYEHEADLAAESVVSAIQPDAATTGQRNSFGHVRVHTDPRATESADALNARAYTVGRDIVFGAGQFQPHTLTGQRLLAHELVHTLQQRGSVQRKIQRAMKFELQTENVVWRTGGKKNEKLPRKFGPKDKEFLHKGTKGKPAKGAKEGTAIELQSEAHGFVEFETASWLRDWCDLKEQMQEAVDMVDSINKSKVISTDAGGVETVEFPFDVSHLKKTKAFPKGLTAGEKLKIEILDPTWTARIQASEAFELSQFESYLTEHMAPARVTSITGSAKKILDDANTAPKIPDKDLVNLLSLLQIIVETITEAQRWNTKKRRHKLAKENISLMSRTNFSSIYRVLLDPYDQFLFRDIVDRKAILKELGVTNKTRVFPFGFTGAKSPGPTIHEWLLSIYKQDRDLLSSLGGDNSAMGRFDIVTTLGEKDTNLVKFEARATTHNEERPVVEWIDFAEEVFKDAYTNRPRMGSTELKYDPTKCP